MPRSDKVWPAPLRGGLNDPNGNPEVAEAVCSRLLDQAPLLQVEPEVRARFGAQDLAGKGQNNLRR